MKKRFTICALCIINYALCFAGPKIYINPGHGGYNSNDRNIVTINHASGDHDGFWESQANLTKGLYLRDMLQAAGATVYMSRTDNRSGYRDDKSISNTIGDRPLSTIAREASSKAEFFLSIHSNAGANSTTNAVNYLLLMLTGTNGSSDWGASFQYSEAVTAANYAWTRLSSNDLTAWTSTTKRVMSYTTYTVISPSYLTIPGYLSEGEFHDYKPETHRLLNNDYCKLEAYRFLQAFCDYYSSSLTRPTTGVICGDVRDASVTMTSTSLYQKATGSKDNNTPLNGAKVKLKKDGKVVATYICDNEYNGFYAFWDVAPGIYEVQCAAAGHASNTQTVTVTAANITYNNVKLGSGSGDGMEDVVVTPLSVLYDTLIDHSAATWLNSQTIQRVVVKKDSLYVLTKNSHIYVVNAQTGTQIGELSTSGISATERTIGDIALTEDNILVGCTQEHTKSDGSVYLKTYKWTHNNAAPVKIFQNNSSANMYDVSVGRSMALKGNLNNFKAFSIAFSLQSAGLRLLQYTWNGTSVSAIRNNNNTSADSTIWNTAELMKSPYTNTQFLINSKTIYPTMLNVTQTDGNNFTANEYSNLQLGTSGGTFVTYQDHVLYVTPYGSDNLGVGIYEATNGLGSASLIKTLYPETVLTLTNAGYMTAAAEVDGDELVVTLYAQNRGIDRWRLSQNELEVTVVVPPTTPVGGAAVYASELTMSESGDIYTFSYRLNTDATDVTLQLLYEGTVVQSKSFGAQAKGVRSGTIARSEITFPTPNAEAHLTWSIQATAANTNVLTKLSDDATKYQFYRPFGVAVDNNPESEYFGRVYVTNTKNGTCTANGATRTTANGLFAFDAELNALNETAHAGGVTWNNSTTEGNSPFRLTVAPDGRIFLCDWSDEHSGIWIAPAGGVTGNFTELFAGLTRDGSGLCTNGSSVPVHGSISGCWVEGSGADTKLYTMDEDYVVDTKSGNMLRYDIGNATSWTAAPSAVAFNNAANGNLLQNMTLKMVSDLRGGWWIIQYRYAETSEVPSLIHVRNGSVDYNTGGEQLLDNSRNGGLAVNYDGTRIATTGQKQINVWDVTYNADGSFESITSAFEITETDVPSGLGASSNDVAFDPAGNIYYVSNSSERLVVIGLPKTNNSFTTPARSVYAIPLPDVAPSLNVLVTEWEQAGLTVDFRTTPTATGVVVKIGSLITATLPLESVLAHTATGTASVDYVKHVTLPDIDLTTYAGHTMTLKWMANDAVIAQTELTIPTLIGSGELSTINYQLSTDLVVLPNATWTLDLSEHSGALTIHSLEVYPGAKAIISNGTLTLTDLILRAGWTTAHTAFRVPKLALLNAAAVAPTNAYLDCVIDYAQYYPFAVPFAVTRSAITYRDYPSAPAASGVFFRQYNGAQRATGATGANWQNITPTTLEPAVGYAIIAKRMQGTMYSTIRMPMNMSSTANTVSITAYGVGSGQWNNVGWNFIANPYTVTFNGNDDASFAGVLQTQADGSGIRYATIPTADFQDYYQVPIDEAKLEPMSPFFVQAAADGNVTFLAAQQNPTLAPASRTINYQLSTINYTDLRLRFSGSNAFDQTYILLGEDFTDEPDLNADLPKEFGRAPKIWSALATDNASLALPDSRTEYTIPLSVQTDVEDYFTFTLSDRSTLTGLARIELTDNGNIVADLMTDSYRVLLPKTTITDRFALHLVRPNNTPTDLSSNSAAVQQQGGPTSNTASGPSKRLQDAQVVIDYNGRTYTILGSDITQ